eukprot:1293911-Rhodomonas_salina.1
MSVPGAVQRVVAEALTLKVPSLSPTRSLPHLRYSLTRLLPHLRYSLRYSYIPAPYALAGTDIAPPNAVSGQRQDPCGGADSSRYKTLCCVTARTKQSRAPLVSWHVGPRSSSNRAWVWSCRGRAPSESDLKQRGFALVSHTFLWLWLFVVVIVAVVNIVLPYSESHFKRPITSHSSKLFAAHFFFLAFAAVQLEMVLLSAWAGEPWQSLYYCGQLQFFSFVFGTVVKRVHCVDLDLSSGSCSVGSQPAPHCSMSTSVLWTTTATASAASDKQLEKGPGSDQETRVRGEFCTVTRTIVGSKNRRQ